MKYLLLALILISGCSITGSTILEPKLEGPFIVTKVVDGDTLDLNNSLRIRMSGINTPETGECYYSEAKGKLSETALNKDVYIEEDITDKDKYGRSLRYVYIDNKSVNNLLVENGFARVYDKYEKDTKRYKELKKFEEKAKQNLLGVWNCTDPKKKCLFVASNNSKKYHTPDCKYAKKIKPENLVCYKSEEEIKNKEFSGC